MSLLETKLKAETEAEFGIVIPDAEASACLTTGDAALLLERRMNALPAATSIRQAQRQRLRERLQYISHGLIRLG